MYKTNGEHAQKGKSNRGDSGPNIVYPLYRADEYDVVGLCWNGEKQEENGVGGGGEVVVVIQRQLGSSCIFVKNIMKGLIWTK